MPPFKYDPYRNPYGPSIAEALAQQGTIEAAGALRAGNLQADAAQQRGAIQAHMWGGVGNALAAIPQQMRQNKELALRAEQQQRQAEIQGMQLDEARRAQKTRQVLEQELGNPENYHPDGRLNEGLVLPRLQQQDFGAYQQVQAMASKRQADALTQAKALSGLAVDEATLAEKAGKRAADSQENLGKAAFTAGQELQPDQPLQGRDYAAQIVGRQVAAGTVSQADANRFYLALAQAQPDEVAAIIRGATAPDLRAKILKEQAGATPDFKPADNLEGPNGESVAFNPASGWYQTADGVIVKTPQIRKPVETPAQVETARHNREVERISALTAGRGEAAQQETARHNAAMEAAAAGKKTSRPVLSSDANRVTDINTGIREADALLTEISGKTGTGSWLGSQVPNVVTDLTGLGTESKQRQAVIDRVKQLIGKTLEGGVLRKEDEIKYEKILPTIGDPVAVTTAKLAGLRAMLERKRETTLESLADAGFNVDAYKTRGAPTVPGVVPPPVVGQGAPGAGATPKGDPLGLF